MTISNAPQQYPLQNLAVINLLVSTLVLIIGIFLLADGMDRSAPAPVVEGARGAPVSDEQRQLVSLINALEQDCPVILLKSESEVVAFAPECSATAPGASGLDSGTPATPLAHHSPAGVRVFEGI